MKTISYYGSRISEALSKTPEGFLICRDVPIARIGTQEYLGSEVGHADNSDAVFSVLRPEKEVFAPAAIASFEGKPVCDDHPSEEVGADNCSRYMKGVVRDVRKGQDKYKGCLVADLIIHDAELIRKIEDGKREISCGYSCLWVPVGKKGYEQREIRGNHVAVVDKGRAGHNVAIHDAAIKQKAPAKVERRPKMAETNILRRMFASFQRDADPDEVLEGAKEVNRIEEGQKEAVKAPEPVKEPVRDGVETRVAAIEKKLDTLLAALSKTEEAHDEVEEPKDDEEIDALDNLEELLKGKSVEDEDEEEAEVDPEAINEAQSETDDDGNGLIEVKQEEGAEETRDSAIQVLQSLKPVIAKLPGKADRRKAADALAELLRGKVNDSGYIGVMRAATKKRVAKDSGLMDDEAYGRMIRDKFNPHYKKN